MTTQTDSKILDYALDYADHGIHVLWVKPDKLPYKIMGGAETGATKDHDLIKSAYDVLESQGHTPSLAIWLKVTCALLTLIIRTAKTAAVHSVSSKKN